MTIQNFDKLFWVHSDQPADCDDPIINVQAAQAFKAYIKSGGNGHLVYILDGPNAKDGLDTVTKAIQELSIPQDKVRIASSYEEIDPIRQEIKNYCYNDIDIKNVAPSKYGKEEYNAFDSMPFDETIRGSKSVSVMHLVSLDKDDKSSGFNKTAHLDKLINYFHSLPNVTQLIADGLLAKHYDRTPNLSVLNKRYIKYALSYIHERQSGWLANLNDVKSLISLTKEGDFPARRGRRHENAFTLSRLLKEVFHLEEDTPKYQNLEKIFISCTNEFNREVFSKLQEKNQTEIADKLEAFIHKDNVDKPHNLTETELEIPKTVAQDVMDSTFANKFKSICEKNNAHSVLYDPAGDHAMQLLKLNNQLTTGDTVHITIEDAQNVNSLIKASVKPHTQAWNSTWIDNKPIADFLNKYLSNSMNISDIISPSSINKRNIGTKAIKNDITYPYLCPYNITLLNRIFVYKG